MELSWTLIDSLLVPYFDLQIQELGLVVQHLEIWICLMEMTD